MPKSSSGSAKASMMRLRLVMRAKIADSKDKRLKMADQEKAMRAQLRRMK